MSERLDRATERLEDMRTATDAIAEYVARGRETYDSDAAVMHAILYQLGHVCKRA